MNKYIYILFFIILISCDSENVNDCFQKSGDIITQNFDIEDFDVIRVNKGVSLILKQGEKNIVVETGENLINDIELEVQDNLLTVSDNNNCNLFREYGITKVYVTVPDLKKIISSTQFPIQSDGLLNFTELEITSEDFNDPTVNAVGDIDLSINTPSLSITVNNLTNITLNGFADNFILSVASGDGKINTRELSSNNVRVFHRGTNTVTVNPINELRAELRSTGNLIVTNQPSVIDIEEYFTGQVIFE